MNRLITLGAVALGGAIVFRVLSRTPRQRLGSALKRRMLGHMEQMMKSLPAGSPPKLIMSVLPQLRDQNDQIIAMLREQNALLREHLHKPQ